MNEDCPLGHDALGDPDARGRRTCAVCRKMRERMWSISTANRHAGRHARETLLRVPNHLLRERYEALIRAGVSPAVMARRAGMLCKRKDGRVDADVSLLKRRLGLAPDTTRKNGQRYKYVLDTVEYETAVRLCCALEIEYPAEVGV